MGLIRVPRHTAADISAWERWERQDAAWSRTQAFRDRCREAIDTIVAFASGGPCWLSVSWGKDSTVLAHLGWSVREEYGIDLPMVWIVWTRSQNPHCPLVRDAFLSRWPMPYSEQIADWTDDVEDPEVVWQEAIRAVHAVHGPRWIGGMRADESAMRRRRMARGLVVSGSCQPMGHWEARDVWAYLYVHDLPVHPAYAMTFGGAMDRDRIRVAALLRQETRRNPASYRMELEERGTGMGRAYWEAAYYGDEP